MNKLIMVVYSGDVCSWNSKDIYPIWGESPDDVMLEYYDLKQKHPKPRDEFSFYGITFNDGYTDEPYVYTVEEWFENCGMYRYKEP